jgi:hypothetical protein
MLTDGSCGDTETMGGGRVQSRAHCPVGGSPTEVCLVVWKAPWRESKTAEPSDNMFRKEHAQRTRLQRTVNVEVASLHVIPVAETVYNARRQQGLDEMSPMRQPSPAGYQRRHGVKDGVSTGETVSGGKSPPRRRRL